MVLRLLGLVAVVAVATGCSGTERNTISGSLVLHSDNLTVQRSTTSARGPAACGGQRGYGDIGPGSRVTVRDGEGEVLASTALGAGTVVGPGYQTCRFEFSLADVPGADFYQITVGARDPMTYSADDLRSRGWRVDLTLGDSAN